jgi:GT2 family glycosyltransferase
MTSISVVIATHQRAVLIDRCLRALEAQVFPATEVIVIDDASADRTPAVLREWVRRPSINIRAQRLEVNGGPARARNRGIALAHGEWVAFTDDDCAPEPDWLAAMAARAKAAPDAVAGVGGRVRPMAPGLVADYMTVHRILEPPSSCSYIVTSNCIYRRRVLLEVGGFNENVRTPGGEDPGLSFAVRQAGYSLGFCPEAVVRHHYRESIVDFIKTFYRYGRGCRLVMD